jgi:hypothetical protein
MAAAETKGILLPAFSLSTGDQPMDILLSTYLVLSDTSIGNPAYQTSMIVNSV